MSKRIRLKGGVLIGILLFWMIFPVMGVCQTRAKRPLWDIPGPYRGRIVKEQGHGFPKKLIALTFDDGPTGATTPLMLDILKRFHVRATFFLIGMEAADHPKLVKRLIAEGHSVGIHTYSHKKHPSAARAASEFVRCEAIMKSQTASLMRTETLESQSTRVFDEKPTSTAPGKVIYREFQVPSKPQAPLGAIDIDDLVAEFEQSPAAAKAIAKGRQWVAKTFYNKQPSSIAKIRLQKGWSQADLARRADTSQPYIARLELGKVDPQVSTVKKLARALDVPVVAVVQAISPEDEQ